MVKRTKEVCVSLVIIGLSGGLLFGGTGDDHGNNAAASTPVLVPSSTLGNVEVGADVDWFRFSAIVGTDYTFVTILETLTDSVLRLIDTDGVTTIAFDDDGGEGLASRIEWTAPANGTYYLEVRAFSGIQTGTYSLVITSEGVQPGLTLSIAQASISESGGVSQATVTRSPGTSGALTVTLTSSDTTEATVPSTVTIPDGASFATFTVTGVDDAVVDGTQTVTITASASGHTSDSDTVEVTDDMDDVPIVSIDIYPNRAPNRVYLSRNYTIYVAVLGSDDFDVTNTDASSVLFGRTGTEAGAVRAPFLRDLDGDGFLDAMYGFQTFDCGFQLGDIEGWLTGFTSDGIPFIGGDSVVVLP